MGRVYEALKRAAETHDAVRVNNGPTEAGTFSDANDLVHERAPIVAGRKNGSHIDTAASVVTTEPVFPGSTIFKAPGVAQVPASNERIEQIVGTALSDISASHAAGATLDARGSTRTAEYITLDISAAHVEPHLIAITQPRSPYTERYRTLRTRVLHAGERKSMKAFVITSADVMEGKTLTAINLSWLLAQTDGVRALLIDGDLRHPSVADYLGVDAPVGLSEVLAGEAKLDRSILKLNPSGLHFLPGGARRDDVAEMLSGPKWSEVLKEARCVFDYIIIDAPPLGIFTDATMLINRADSALIVARSGKTRYAALDRVLEPLQRERILGVVLNGSNEEMNEQGYYYRHRDYTRQDKSSDGTNNGRGAANQASSENGNRHKEGK